MSQFTPYYLRATDEQSLMDAICAAVPCYEDDDGVDRPTLIAADYQIVILPTLTEPTGNMLTDDDGNEYPEYAPVPGYHANVIMAPGVPLPDALAAIEIEPEPQTPMVEWSL